MSRTLEMFEKPPRRARRVLMHAIDHGYANAPISHFVCQRCGHDEGWCTRTEREARHGAPCPKCNALPMTAAKIDAWISGYAALADDAARAEYLRNAPPELLTVLALLAGGV